MKLDTRIKVLLSKVGLDRHEIGIKVVASALCDAGMAPQGHGVKEVFTEGSSTRYIVECVKNIVRKKK